MSAPERIWLDWPDANRGDAVYDEPPERDTQPGQTEYICKDASDAAIAAARAEGWAAAIEAVKVEIKEWLALPAVPPKNPRAEVYDEACHNILRFVCDLKPAAEAQP